MNTLRDNERSPVSPEQLRRHAQSLIVRLVQDHHIEAIAFTGGKALTPKERGEFVGLMALKETIDEHPDAEQPKTVSAQDPDFKLIMAKFFLRGMPNAVEDLKKHLITTNAVLLLADAPREQAPVVCDAQQLGSTFRHADAANQGRDHINLETFEHTPSTATEQRSLLRVHLPAIDEYLLPGLDPENLAAQIEDAIPVLVQADGVSLEFTGPGHDIAVRNLESPRMTLHHEYRKDPFPIEAIAEAVDRIDQQMLPDRI